MDIMKDMYNTLDKFKNALNATQWQNDPTGVELLKDARIHLFMRCTEILRIILMNLHPDKAIVPIGTLIKDLEREGEIEADDAEVFDGLYTAVEVVAFDSLAAPDGIVKDMYEATEEMLPFFEEEMRGFLDRFVEVQ